MSVFLCVLTVITGVIFLIFLMVPFFGNSTPLYLHLAYIYESQTLFTSLSFVFLALIILLCFVIFKRKLKEEISSYLSLKNAGGHPAYIHFFAISIVLGSRATIAGFGIFSP